MLLVYVESQFIQPCCHGCTACQHFFRAEMYRHQILPILILVNGLSVISFGNPVPRGADYILSCIEAVRVVKTGLIAVE